MPQFTKQAIAQALKTRMNEKSLDKITVKELVEECKINRQTFYYHFQDIYDLLGWIYETEAIGAIQNNRSYETWQQGLLIILEYVQENREMCLNTYRSLAREHLEVFLNGALYDLLGGVINEVAINSSITDQSKVFITKFYSYAFTGVLLDWIKSGMKAPCHDIVKQVSLVMKDNFVLAIERFETVENP